MLSRRSILISLGAGVGVVGAAGYFALKPIINPEPAPVGFDLREGTLENAIALLKENPAIDVHSHPGRTFVRGAKDLSLKLRIYAMVGSFEERTIADMRAGFVSSAGFSGVADFPVLDAGKEGLATRREFHQNEAWNYYHTQLDNLNALSEKGLIRKALTPQDIVDAHAAGDISMFLAMEGGDFLDGKIERVKLAYDDGMRMITLVHYNNNALGDIITDPQENGGLTEFGGAVVEEMNRLGLMIDLSHASEKTAIQAVEISNKPTCLTHTHFRSSDNDHSRFVSVDLARKVVSSGGFIGAWPAGIGISNLGEFIVRIEELVNEFGEDGVAIGADMDANYKPVYGNFRQMPLIVGGLIERGHSTATIAKIIGGNFLRVFNMHIA